MPLRQWVISSPFLLLYLFAAHPQAMGKVLGIVYRDSRPPRFHRVKAPYKGELEELVNG